MRDAAVNFGLAVCGAATLLIQNLKFANSVCLHVAERSVATP